MSMVYLIRHGATRANEGHLYCGSTDLPLSEIGRRELSELHYGIKDVRFVISGMRRTEETLKLLFGDVEYETEPAFKEIDFGVFEMGSYEELKDREDYRVWLTGDNMRNVPPGGESGEQMTQRVLRALPQLLDRDTVLITHGGVIAAIMDCLFPQEGKTRYEWQPVPGHGYAVTGKTYRTIP